MINLYPQLTEDWDKEESAKELGYVLMEEEGVKSAQGNEAVVVCERNECVKKRDISL